MCCASLLQYLLKRLYSECGECNLIFVVWFGKRKKNILWAHTVLIRYYCPDCSASSLFTSLFLFLFYRIQNLRGSCPHSVKMHYEGTKRLSGDCSLADNALVLQEMAVPRQTKFLCFTSRGLAAGSCSAPVVT